MDVVMGWVGAVDDLTYKREVTEKPDKVPVSPAPVAICMRTFSAVVVFVIGKQRVVVDWGGAFPC